jgi:hypothetical protein
VYGVGFANRRTLALPNSGKQIKATYRIVSPKIFRQLSLLLLSCETKLRMVADLILEQSSSGALVLRSPL